MVKFLSAIIVLVSLSQVAYAGITFTHRTKQGKIERRLIELHHEADDFDRIAIHEFRWVSGQNGRNKWNYTRTLIQGTETELQRFVTTKSPSSLSQSEADELLSLIAKHENRGKDGLSMTFVSAVTGPVLPAVFLGAGVFNSLSAGKKHEKLIEQTHPFILLLATEKKKQPIYIEKNFLSFFENELSALLDWSNSVFEPTIKESKEKAEGRPLQPNVANDDHTGR